MKNINLKDIGGKMQEKIKSIDPKIALSSVLGAGTGMAFVSISKINEANAAGSEELAEGEGVDAVAGVSESIATGQSFSEIFAQERASQGAGGVFTYNGEIYNTYYAEEWDAMSSAEQADYLASAQQGISKEYHQLSPEEKGLNIDGDAMPEIILSDINNDGNIDVFKVDLNNDGHYDIEHVTHLPNTTTSQETYAESGSSDVEPAPEEMVFNEDVESFEEFEDFEDFDITEEPDLSTAEAEDAEDFDFVDEEDITVPEQYNESEESVEEAYIGEEDLESEELIIDEGDMIDPSDFVEEGDMIEPSNEIESGDMIDPSDMIEENDLVDPSEAIEEGDMVDPSDSTSEFSDGLTDTDLDMSEFDF